MVVWLLEEPHARNTCPIIVSGLDVVDALAELSHQVPRSLVFERACKRSTPLAPPAKEAPCTSREAPGLMGPRRAVFPLWLWRWACGAAALAWRGCAHVSVALAALGGRQALRALDAAQRPRALAGGRRGVPCVAAPIEGLGCCSAAVARGPPPLCSHTQADGCDVAPSTFGRARRTDSADGTRACSLCMLAQGARRVCSRREVTRRSGEPGLCGWSATLSVAGDASALQALLFGRCDEALRDARDWTVVGMRMPGCLESEPSRVDAFRLTRSQQVVSRTRQSAREMSSAPPTTVRASREHRAMQEPMLRHTTACHARRGALFS